MHTVKAALEEAYATIERIDAQVLLCHVLGVNRAWLAGHPMRVLTETEDARLDSLVTQRALGAPVAYLVEKREFYGRDFSVGPGVLIPRPETEVLVEAALERMAPDARCVDLGTGSGAIAITLACERPGARVTATDVSEAALAIARANAALHGCDARMTFAPGAWYDAIARQRFDLIVSNPPYVAAADAHLDEGDLRFEPRHALTDGSPDGLGSIRAIVAGAREHLAPGGWLLFEHGYDQAGAAARVLERAGFDARLSLADLAGIPRVAGGKLAD
ncbi:MAG TPA: peptide chain release factor N(5)-glutamine methyltransferase [Usitatibacter sp.]|nr:peptide chain release factor N(5)-glutamine methyltransferase [Usitatibacter sp.]